MGRHVDLRHEDDPARVGEAHEARDVRRRVTAIRVAGERPRSRRQAGRREGEGLVVGEVQLHRVEREQVGELDRLLHRLDRMRKAREVEHQPAPRERRRVVDPDRRGHPHPGLGILLEELEQPRRRAMHAGAGRSREGDVVAEDLDGEALGVGRDRVDEIARGEEHVAGARGRRCGHLTSEPVSRARWSARTAAAPLEPFLVGDDSQRPGHHEGSEARLSGEGRRHDGRRIEGRPLEQGGRGEEERGDHGRQVSRKLPGCAPRALAPRAEGARALNANERSAARPARRQARGGDASASAFISRNSFAQR